MKKTIIIILLSILFACEKPDILLPDKSKENLKEVALIDTEIFLKEGGVLMYTSTNKFIHKRYKEMILIIIKDTLRQGDYYNFTVSNTMNSRITYKIRLMNKGSMIIGNGTTENEDVGQIIFSIPEKYINN